MMVQPKSFPSFALLLPLLVLGTSPSSHATLDVDALARNADAPLTCVFSEGENRMEAKVTLDSMRRCFSFSLHSSSSGELKNFTCDETLSTSSNQDQLSQDDLLPAILVAAGLQTPRVNQVHAFSVSLDDDGGGWTLLNVEISSRPLSHRLVLAKTSMGGIKTFSCNP